MNAGREGETGEERERGAAAIVVRTIRGCISAFFSVAVSSLSTKLGVALITATAAATATEHSGANDRHASESPRFCKQKLTAWVWAGSTPTSPTSPTLPTSLPEIFQFWTRDRLKLRSTNLQIKLQSSFQVNKVWSDLIENIKNCT